MFSTAFRRVSRLTQCARSIQFDATTSTVNAAEVAHFSRLSSQWWDEKGEFALLHRMNPVRVQYVRDKVIEVAREERGEDVAQDMEQRGALRGMNVLDVGCGGGLLSEVRFSMLFLHRTQCSNTRYRAWHGWVGRLWASTLRSLIFALRLCMQMQIHCFHRRLLRPAAHSATGMFLRRNS